MTNTNESHVCISKGNEKMGTIPSVSLPAITTCRKCGCNKLCYATKGRFTFGNVKNSLDRNLDILLEDSDKYWREVSAAMMMNRFFRFHVSGDIPNMKYLENLVKVTRENKHCEVLIFTKKFELVNKYLENHKFPKNLHMMFSAWKGLEMPNPHKLPEAHVFYSDGTTTAQPKAKPCGGHCINCILRHEGCWVAKKNEQILIIEH